jgi:FtsH-binding integral membrane protein
MTSNCGAPGRLMAIGEIGLATRVDKEVSTAQRLKTFLSRYFYLCMGLVMAGLVAWGFSRTVDHNLFHASPPRPLLLWMHGTAFSTWIIFFIAQSAFVRVHKVSVHRTLGWFGAGLATVMVPLGCTVAIVMTRFDMAVLQEKNVDSFLSIPFTDMLIFGACIGAAIYWRRKPEYHRRLIFIATCELMDAAIGRFDFWFDHSIFYAGLDLLIVLGMARDYVVDGRVHKVYRYALPAMIVLQGLAIYLWRGNPAWWQAITHAIL